MSFDMSLQVPVNRSSLVGICCLEEEEFCPMRASAAAPDRPDLEGRGLALSERGQRQGHGPDPGGAAADREDGLPQLLHHCARHRA